MHIVQAQMPNAICNWDNDRKAAIVLTFDDWSPGHSPIVIPELQSRGINATFFVMNNTASYSWSQIIAAANNGNEIGNHTKTHPNNLTSTTPTLLTDEIDGMMSLINQKITNQTVTTFAYPFGNSNATVVNQVKSSGHIGARGVSQGSFSYNFATTNDSYYNLSTYSMCTTTSTTTFSTQIQNVINGGGLLTYLYHSVNSATVADSWYCGVTQTNLQAQLDALVAKKDIVWITTLSQAIKYHKEKNCATLSETQAPNGTTWKLNLTDTLSNNALWNQPLSIKIKKNGVNYISVIQNGVVLPIDLNRNDSIMFRAVPDGGEITLTTDWVTATTASQIANANITISPVPSNGMITIHAFTPIAPSSIAVYDIMGNKLFDKKDVSLYADYQIDLSPFKEGTYFVYIYEGDTVVVKKVIRMN